jgi:hypothetical protein
MNGRGHNGSEEIWESKWPVLPFPDPVPQSDKLSAAPSDQGNFQEIAKGFPSAARIGSPRILKWRKKRSTTALAVICMSSRISCQNTADWWLLKFHTYGLLNNSFQPPSEIHALHTYWRQRGEHVQGAATCVQRMQKALTQTNVQLANQSFGERLSQSNWRGGR